MPGGLELFVFASEQYASKRLKLDRFEDLTRIEIALLRNAELRVDLGGRTGLADGFELRNADDEPTSMLLSEGMSGFWVKQGWFSGGRSGLYVVPEGEFWIVLLLDGQEVSRTRVVLRAGETSQVDF